MPALADAPPSKAAPESFVPQAAFDIDDVLSNRVSLEPEPPKKEITPVIPEVQKEDEEDDTPIGDLKTFEPVKPGEGEAPNPDAPINKKKENSKIREQMEKVLQEKAAQEKLVQERDERLKQLQAEYDKIKQEAATKSTIADDLQKKLAIGDPNLHPGVKEIEEPWINKRNEVMSEVELTGEDPAKFNQWTFAAINVLSRAGEPGTEGYRTAVGNLRQDYLRNFPEAQDYLMSAMTLVKDGVTTAKKRDGFVTELKSNYPAIQFQETMKYYNAQVQQYEQDERKVFNPEEDIKINDPLNPSVILRAMIDGSEQVRDAAEKAKAIVRYTLLPPRPIDPSSLEGEEDGKKAEILQQHHSRYIQSFMKFRSRAAEAIVALQVLPALWKENEALRAKIKEQKNEPSPHLGEDQHSRVSGSAPDMTTFQPVENTELAEVKRGRR